MKKPTVTSLAVALIVVSLAALSAPAEQAPSATSSKEALRVLSDMIKALGGRKALESVEDTTLSGEIELDAAGQALSGPVTIYQKEPDKMRIDITFPEYNLNVVQAFDGQKGWFTNPQTGGTEEMPDFMVREFARQATGTRAILDPKGAGVVYALKPKATIEGKDTIVLEQTYADGFKVTLYLDPETYLPCKTQNRGFDLTGGEVEEETFSTDYKKVGDLMIAHAVRILHNGVEAQRVTISAVTFNTGLDDALFFLK
jgi:outer membrane lipoprotein-sorting protein